MDWSYAEFLKKDFRRPIVTEELHLLPQRRPFIRLGAAMSGAGANPDPSIIDPAG